MRTREYNFQVNLEDGDSFEMIIDAVNEKQAINEMRTMIEESGFQNAKFKIVPDNGVPMTMADFDKLVV